MTVANGGAVSYLAVAKAWIPLVSRPVSGEDQQNPVSQEQELIVNPRLTIRGT